jgi:hypothetical protein
VNVPEPLATVPEGPEGARVVSGRRPGSHTAGGTRPSAMLLRHFFMVSRKSGSCGAAALMTMSGLGLLYVGQVAYFLSARWPYLLLLMLLRVIACASIHPLAEKRSSRKLSFR